MNQHDRKKLYTALQEGAMTYMSDEGKVQRVITSEWDLAGDVWSIEDLTHKLIATTATLFSVKVGKSNQIDYYAVRLGKSLLQALKTDFAALGRHYPMHVFNPYVEEFIRQAKACNAIETAMTISALRGDEITTGIKVLNDFVDSIRQAGNAPEFKDTIANFSRSANQRYRETNELINAHFKNHSRMLVMRFDFGYEKDKGWPGPTKDPVTYAETRKHRQELLKYLKKMPSNNAFIASACRMEYGLDKKWHYHCLLLVDGADLRGDVTIPRLIGEHWKKTITQGRGLYWNCNANKDSYKCCGIGMVSHDDMDMREGLKKAVLYMTKPDYYIKLLVPDNHRTFWKTNMPEPKTDKRGRPRTKTWTQPGTMSMPLNPSGDALL